MLLDEFIFVYDLSYRSCFNICVQIFNINSELKQQHFSEIMFQRGIRDFDLYDGILSILHA